MNHTDEWGRDPSIQIMRKVFKAIEMAQSRLLQQLDMDPYDLRIRGWREKALSLFEQAWVTANRMSINMDEEMASAIYIHGFAKIIGSEGIEVPSGILQSKEEIEKVIAEVFK
jgi:hypothetical protein